MTFKKWLVENLGPCEGEDEGYIHDIATHGCAAGFPGLTNYSDTCALYDKYEDELWEVMREMADWTGYKNVLNMLGQCNSGGVDSPTTFKNLAVWVVAEKYARQLTDD